MEPLLPNRRFGRYSCSAGLTFQVTRRHPYNSTDSSRISFQDFKLRGLHNRPKIREERILLYKIWSLFGRSRLMTRHSDLSSWSQNCLASENTQQLLLLLAALSFTMLYSTTSRLIHRRIFCRLGAFGTFSCRDHLFVFYTI